MQAELTDDQLASMPEANLLPGQLSRAFLARATLHEKQQARADDEAGIRLFRDQQLETEHEREDTELHDREAALLRQIHAREEELRLEARELDKRTIRLADGRRAYLDGDKYRDEQGRELDGADRAQAEQHHLELPHAATWQEHQALTSKFTELEKAREQVLALQAGNGNANAAKALDQIEKAQSAQLAAGSSAKMTVPDYGSADYMTELGSLAGSFNQVSHGTPIAPAGTAPAPGTMPVPALRQRI